MITTKIKRKIIITKVVVSKPERFKPFEIRIPANVTKITGVLVTVAST